MLVEERRQKIIELVNQQKSARVKELSKTFKVTEETIRRDLEKLEKSKKLTRSHGGAVCIASSEAVEVPYFEREVINVEAKKKIALEAAEMIVKGDKIILDASSTAWYMAKVMPNIPTTVLTNSIKVAMELSSKSHVNVISTGGVLLSKSLSFVGPLAEASLRTYHVNKAFISCKGLDLDHGISDSNEQQALIKREMIERADFVYVMLDRTKIGFKAFAHIHQINKIDEIITDIDENSDLIKQFKNKSLNFTLV